ncbi:CoA-binding protein [Variovorax paradoxus]|uniref:CoA-binding protein n=1 Tax=Variovorax paradoxus TaxID=34073 RepID=A0A5Q0M3G7_VARPD|nr:acetate--CoA ligase family protein [Variovorax paradoxus]QFZ84006.1 CoA-binding protein [Variovorax paradoxus]
MSDITALLEPQSIVVIGASEDPTRIGGRPLKYLRSSGFAGAVYVVNPNRESVQGFDSYKSVDSLPQVVDLAIIALPAHLAGAALDDCGRKGIRTAIIFSAGFSETDEAGQRMQTDIAALSQRHGIRVLGPNCLGVFNSHIGFYGTFTQALSGGFLEPGPVAIVSQSGACGGHLAYLCRQRNIGIGYWITTGNEVDLGISECLHWLACSPKVRVIVAYAEAVRNGPMFVQALEAARARGKPVIILKVGRSVSGARAAASHTGALAGEDAVYDAVLQQYGVHRAGSIEEMLDIAYACLATPTFANNQLGVFTVSGGIGVQIADAADEYGVDVPLLAPSAQDEIRALIPFAGTANPIDVTAQLTNERSLLGKCLDIALAQGQFGALVCFLTSSPASRASADWLLETFSAMRERHPDVLCVLSFVAPVETVREFERLGFLVFEDPNRAVRALGALSRFERSFASARLAQEDAALPQGGGSPGLRVDVSDEQAAKRVLAAAGIPSLPEVLAPTAADVRAAVEHLNRPVVLKIVSPDIPHKTEVQGVVLNIDSPDRAHEAAVAMFERVGASCPAAEIRGILVAPMCERGIETICGAYQDPVFGPMVLFGLGGVHVEVLKDVVLRRAPFGVPEARAMIREIRGAALLAGVRGQAPSDTEALARVLVALSVFAFENRDWVAEIDINPFVVLAAGQGGFALDALIQTRGPDPCTAPVTRA